MPKPRGSQIRKYCPNEPAPMEQRNSACCPLPNFVGNDEDYGLVSVQLHASRSSNPIHDMAQFYFDSKGTYKYDVAEFDHWSSTLCGTTGNQARLQRFLNLILRNMRRTIVEMNQAANEMEQQAFEPPPPPAEERTQEQTRRQRRSAKLARMAARLTGTLQDDSSDESLGMVDIEHRHLLARKFQAKRMQAKKAKVVINTQNDQEITLTMPSKVARVEVIDDARRRADERMRKHFQQHQQQQILDNFELPQLDMPPSHYFERQSTSRAFEHYQNPHSRYQHCHHITPERVAQMMGHRQVPLIFNRPMEARVENHQPTATETRPRPCATMPAMDCSPGPSYREQSMSTGSLSGSNQNDNASVEVEDDDCTCVDSPTITIE